MSDAKVSVVHSATGWNGFVVPVGGKVKVFCEGREVGHCVLVDGGQNGAQAILFLKEGFRVEERRPAFEVHSLALPANINEEAMRKAMERLMNAGVPLGIFLGEGGGVSESPFDLQERQRRARLAALIEKTTMQRALDKLGQEKVRRDAGMTAAQQDAYCKKNGLSRFCCVAKVNGSWSVVSESEQADEAKARAAFAKWAGSHPNAVGHLVNFITGEVLAEHDGSALPREIGYINFPTRQTKEPLTRPTEDAGEAVCTKPSQAREAVQQELAAAGIHVDPAKVRVLEVAKKAGLVKDDKAVPACPTCGEPMLKVGQGCDRCQVTGKGAEYVSYHPAPNQQTTQNATPIALTENVVDAPDSRDEEGKSYRDRPPLL